MNIDIHRYSTVYFNPLLKTVINRRYHLNDSFEEILNLLDKVMHGRQIKLIYYTLTHLTMNHY